MEHFFNFSNAIPYILYHFIFSKSTSTRHHHAVSMAIMNFVWMELDRAVHEELNDTKFFYYVFDGAIYFECEIREIFPIHFVLCKLPITAISYTSTSISHFRINLSLVSSCRGSLSVYNGGWTSFVSTSEHELWLIM